MAAPKDKRALRSRLWFDDKSNPGMTALYLERYLNFGLTRGELQSGKPIIGIAQSGATCRHATATAWSWCTALCFDVTSRRIAFVASYLVVTDALAEPPALLLTVMLPGLTGKLSVPANEPLPLPVRVPIVWLVAVTNTVSVAVALVLVACTRNSCLDVRYSASWIPTVSAGTAGETWTLSVRDVPQQLTVMLTVVGAVTLGATASIATDD